jgi:putative acyl-CoA dehydrogenase
MFAPMKAVATRAGEGVYRLSGHKWFLSAPMSDAFVMLARRPPKRYTFGEGLSCFLVPRILEDGSLNGLRLQRLKDKVGNRSNASSEVEFSATPSGSCWASEGEGDTHHPRHGDPDPARLRPGLSRHDAREPG